MVTRSLSDKELIFHVTQLVEGEFFKKNGTSGISSPFVKIFYGKLIKQFLNEFAFHM